MTRPSATVGVCPCPHPITSATLRSGSMLCEGSGRTGSGPIWLAASKSPELQAESATMAPMARREKPIARVLDMLCSLAAKNAGEDHGDDREDREGDAHGHHCSPAVGGVHEVVDDCEEENDNAEQHRPPGGAHAPDQEIDGQREKRKATKDNADEQQPLGKMQPE